MMKRLASFARRARPGRRALAVAACSLLLGSVPLGCTGSAQVRAGVVHDHPVYYVDGPPTPLSRYPYAIYHGQRAYLVDGRWYYSTPSGWAVFRREPRELRHYRENRSALRYHDRRAPRRHRDRADEPTQRRHREGWDERRREPTQQRSRRVDRD